MNDRTQGGTADVANQATIELMQHRRSTREDSRNGFDQQNNEVDLETMKGLRANAIYYMQIFDFKNGKSKQREQQIKTNQPIHYTFSFDQIEMAKDMKTQLTEADVSLERSKNWLNQFEEMNALVNKGNQDLSDIAMQVFPYGRQQVLIRLENLQDKFDLNTAEAKYIDLIEFSKDLWLSAN